MITPEYLDVLAQKAHMLGGGLAMLGPHALWGKRSLRYAVPIFVVCAAAKEFWFDANYQDAEIRGSDLKDFAFYMIGMVLALLLLKTHKRI